MRKYAKLSKIESMNELVRAEFIIVGKKTYHCGWFLSWPIHYALCLIKAGKVYRACAADQSAYESLMIKALERRKKFAGWIKAGTWDAFDRANEEKLSETALSAQKGNP
jgi:hypothetical protein